MTQIIVVKSYFKNLAKWHTDWKADKEGFAKHMRRYKTKAERKLWEHLQVRGFKAQVVLCGYIVDFCHEGMKLVIEADGGIHAQQKAYDRARDLALLKTKAVALWKKRRVV